MSHRHMEEPKTEPKQVIPSSEELHPFFSKNDLSLLNIATPFLSPNGQKLLSFFINFNQNSSHLPDIGGILSQLGNSDSNKLVQDLLPALLGLASKMDQGSFDPSLLTSLLGMFNKNNASPNQTVAD